MKTTMSFLGVAMLSGLMVAQPAPAADQANPARAALHVQVDVPASWRMWLEDDLADAFTDRVREVLRRRGFEGDVKRVDAFDKPAGEVPQLTINLIEWRIGPTGNIECTFTANLQTPRGSRQFGIYTNTTMRWLHGPGRFGLARTFEDAAEGAIRQLSDDMAKTEMLPGLRPR